MLVTLKTLIGGKVLVECQSGHKPNIEFSLWGGWSMSREGRSRIDAVEEGSDVMKINIPVVWTCLCSLSGTLVHFLGVSSVTVSLLLHFPSCFILMPRRNCDHLHYVRGPSCSLLGHRLQSEPLLWFILPAVLEITALMYAASAACFGSSTYSEAWEQWPQGSTVGAKIVQSRGLGIKGWWDGKQKWAARRLEFCENWPSQDDGCVTSGPSGSAGWRRHLSNCSPTLDVD